MIEIDIHNSQTVLSVDEQRLRSAVASVLSESQFKQAEISVAVVDDQRMQQLNAKYLDHDWPTDVLSFVHEAGSDRLEGEIIVSSKTAVRQAAEFDSTPEHELLLYVIHGALHLIGYDDHNDADRQTMRAAERRHLDQLAKEVT